MKLKKVGTVCVDTGMVMIADPGVVLDQTESRADHYKNKGEKDPLPDEFKGISYKELLAQADKFPKEDSFLIPSEPSDGLGVVTTGFGGDGIYPVFYLKDSMYVRGLLVIFDAEYEFGESEKGLAEKEFKRTLRQVAKAIEKAASGPKKKKK
ncbi:DUF4241 domain-containing protein [Candidatus Parcubacteria bacterium]|nr:DUF4241 domain-containing protein [Candidatus Parcubacteria bacterium]